MSIRRALAKLVAESLIGTALAAAGTKIGEAAGDRIAYHINPPDEMPAPDDPEAEDESATD